MKKGSGKRNMKKGKGRGEIKEETEEKDKRRKEVSCIGVQKIDEQKGKGGRQMDRTKRERSERKIDEEQNARESKEKKDKHGENVTDSGTSKVRCTKINKEDMRKEWRD